MVNSNFKFEVPQFNILFFEATNDNQHFFYRIFRNCIRLAIFLEIINAKTENSINILKQNTPNTPN